MIQEAGGDALELSLRPDDDSCEVTESYEVLWEPWYGKVFTPEKRRGPQLDEGIATTLDRLKAHAETGL